MGLSNYTRYTITDHAKRRYRDRIDPNRSASAMKKHFITIMQDAHFLSKENGSCEAWLNEDEQIVLIVDPSTYKVVTIYRAGHRPEPGSEKPLRKEDVKPPSKSERLISEAARELYKQQETHYWAQLAPVYAAYADLMDRLSRTHRDDYRKQMRRELGGLKRDIERLERERESTLSDLEDYMLRG